VTGVKKDSLLIQMVFHVSKDQLQDVDQWKSQPQTTWVACQDAHLWKYGRTVDAYQDVESMK
jgi:hypothetical protein